MMPYRYTLLFIALFSSLCFTAYYHGNIWVNSEWMVLLAFGQLLMALGILGMSLKQDMEAGIFRCYIFFEKYDIGCLIAAVIFMNLFYIITGFFTAEAWFGFFIFTYLVAFAGGIVSLYYLNKHITWVQIDGEGK